MKGNLTSEPDHSYDDGDDQKQDSQDKEDNRCHFPSTAFVGTLERHKLRERFTAADRERAGELEEGAAGLDL